jgi:RNA polymerase sigma-70 factor (ECF subfamily)
LKARKIEVDERLLVEAAQKDPARFAELYDDNFERVYAFVARRVQNRLDAEDLTAEVFHQALAKLGQFEWRGVPFAAWLYRIAANAVADRWKRAAREQGSPIADDPPDSHAGGNPEEVEHIAQLFRMVKTLPDDQRRVIEMRFAEGKSIREIARELHRTEGAIKQLQFRALTSLRVQARSAKTNKQASKKPSRRSGGRNG